jgi:L-seryl-tRNA(Ser) seleniumtransferase
MTLSALEATLRLYLHPEKLAERLPTLRLLTRDAASIRAQGELLLVRLRSITPILTRVESCQSQIGSGSLPVDRLPSAALTFTPRDGAAASLRRFLHGYAPCQYRLLDVFMMAECGWIYAVLKMKSGFWR